GVVGMRAGLHLGPERTQPRIAERFKADFRSVVADYGVIAQHLEEFAAAFGGGCEFGLIGELFEQGHLLLARAIHEFAFVFGSAAGIEPVQSAYEPDLRSGSLSQPLFHRARILIGGDGNAVGQHKVNEFSDTGGFGAGRIVGGNNHFGEGLGQAKLFRQKEKRVGKLRGRPHQEKFVVGAGERPMPKAREGGGDRSDGDVTENFATFNTLSSHKSSQQTKIARSLTRCVKTYYNEGKSESNSKREAEGGTEEGHDQRAPFCGARET